MKPDETLIGAIGLAAAALLATLPALQPAAAQGPKIVVGYTATVDFAPGFIAMDQGLFKKRGLDVEFKIVPLNSQLPAAVQSDSITFGGTTISVLLQAIDGGLDHVAVAGSGLTDKNQESFGAVAKADLPIVKADDFVGQEGGRARHRRLPARAVPQLADRQRRRHQEGDVRRGRLPADGRRAQGRQRRRRRHRRAGDGPHRLGRHRQEGDRPSPTT